jgi:hypothetical protein
MNTITQSDINRVLINNQWSMYAIDYLLEKYKSNYISLMFQEKSESLILDASEKGYSVYLELLQNNKVNPTLEIGIKEKSYKEVRDYIDEYFKYHV